MERFNNYVAMTLAAPCLPGDATITVNDGSSLSLVGNYRLIVESEIMLATSRTGNVITVTRGQESTVAAAHAFGAVVEPIVTAGALDAARLTNMLLMHDADLTITDTVGKTMIEADTVFTADRRVVLPTNPNDGQRVAWADFVPSTTNVNGALATNNLIFDPGAGRQVMAGATGDRGGNILAGTYTATLGAWGPGAEIEVIWSASKNFWKVI